MEFKEYLHPGNFVLETGEKLKDIKICYTQSGPVDGSRPIVWICHALTANADPTDWWPGLVGPGYFLDTEKYTIICANVLSSCYGSTGPLAENPLTDAPYFWDFPGISIRDMVAAHDLLRQHLGLSSIHLLIGGSLGGQQALEWAIMRPDVFDNLVLLATNAFHSPWGIAFNESQRLAIQADPTWEERRADAGVAGLKAARSIALLSYRGYAPYAKTQSESDFNKTDHYRASSYQNYQGEKLVSRFNVFSYWYLSKAMDSHQVARGRESVTAALKTIQAKTLVIAVSSDVLFPPQEQAFLAENIPGAALRTLDSFFGHDGFLIEVEQIAIILKDFLAQE